MPRSDPDQPLSWSAANAHLDGDLNREEGLSRAGYGDDGFSFRGEPGSIEEAARVMTAAAEYALELQYPDVAPIESHPDSDISPSIFDPPSILPDPGRTWGPLGVAADAATGTTADERVGLQWRPADELDMERRVQGFFGARDRAAEIPMHIVFDDLDPDPLVPLPPSMPAALGISSPSSSRPVDSDRATYRGPYSRLTGTRPTAGSALQTAFDIAGLSHPDSFDPISAEAELGNTLRRLERNGTESRSAQRSRVEAMMADPNERRWSDMLMQRSRMTRQGGGGAMSSEDQGRAARLHVRNAVERRVREDPSSDARSTPESRRGDQARSSRQATDALMRDHPDPAVRAIYGGITAGGAAPPPLIVVPRDFGDLPQTLPTNIEQRTRLPITIGRAALSAQDSVNQDGTDAAEAMDVEMELDPLGGSSGPTGLAGSSSVGSLRGAADISRRPETLPWRQTHALREPYVPAIDQGRRLSPYTGLARQPLTKEEMPSYLRRARLPIQQLPMQLNELDTAARLKLEETGRNGRKGVTQVTFVGTGAGGDADAAAVRADAPIQPACGVWYMECDIISKGQEGFISIGLSRKWTNLSRLVGWEPGSYGWHMDDGYVFESKGEGTHRGWPTGTSGDTIGCGIDFVLGQAFFTKNGKFIGHASSNLGRDLYPAIGLRSPGEQVDCNFAGPFRFDIESYIDDRQKAVQREIAEAPVLIRGERPRWGDLLEGKTVQEIKPISPLERWKERQASVVKGIELLPSQTKEDVMKAHEEGAVDPSKLAMQSKVTDVDGALAGVVLQYLQHEGYSSAASAMQSSLQSGIGGSAAFNNATKTSDMSPGWNHAEQSANKVQTRAQAEARFTAQLNSLRTAYKAGWVSQSWRILRDFFPDQLLTNGCLWSFRLRMQWFAQLVASLAEGVEPLIADIIQDRKDRHITAGHITKPDLGLNAFTYFICGLSDMDALPTTPAEWLVAVGRQMHSCGCLDNPDAEEKMRLAFACMAYDSPDDWPLELWLAADRSEWEDEAEELLAEIRISCGEKDKSYLEEAVIQTADTLFDLGIKRGFAAATFADSTGLLVPDLLREVGNR